MLAAIRDSSRKNAKSTARVSRVSLMKEYIQ